MTVTAYLETDHERLDAILERVGELASAGSFADARRELAAVVTGLGRHIDAEERILFPAFEELTHVTTGPTVVMRSEHVEIRRLLDAVATALDAGSARAAASLAALVDVLEAHNMKEERVLYPMTDRALRDDAARNQLVQRLRAAME